MKGSATRDKRRSALFYGLTARDVITAEYLAGRIDGFFVSTAGPAFGFGYFGWSGKPKSLAARRGRLRRLAVKAILVSAFVLYTVPLTIYRALLPQRHRAKLSKRVRPSHFLSDMRRKLSAVVSQVEKKSSMHPNWGINFLLGIIQCVRAVLALIGYMGWKRAALKLIRNSAPDAVILFEENAEGLSCVMAGVARQAGVPYLIIPQTIPNPDEPAHFYRTSPQHDGERALAKILTRFMPQWQFTYQGRRLLRQPIPKILAQQLFGVAPDRPWFLNSGRASAICVECEALRRQYIALGFPPAQLVVIGHPIDDTLHAISLRRKEVRFQLEQELGLFPGRPLVVVGFPPDQYTSPDTSAFEWPDFESMCRVWKDALDVLRPTCNVIVRPHPRLRTAQLQPFVEAGYPVVSEPTETLIPIADLYVASISATIRWALALGVPVVNYDCYRYRYGDYKRAEGVVTLENWRAFHGTLQGLAAEPTFAQALTQKARLERHEWGTVDGRFAERFSQVLADVHENTRLAFGSKRPLVIAQDHREPVA